MDPGDHEGLCQQIAGEAHWRHGASGDGATAFRRRGTHVVTIATRGTDARAVVAGMREAHYQPVLDGLGVEAWDRHDGDAVHFICFADGVPAASMRTSRDGVGSGEGASVFQDLPSVLPKGTKEYLYLSRQLVVPEFRGIGLSAVITHVAAAWWRSHSPLEYVLGSSRKPTLGNARLLGGTVLAGPVCLGPEKMAILLVGAQLSAVAERTKMLLDRFSWSPAAAGPVVRAEASE
jgi:hypothetical protein